ncbi:hypothetical protein RDABS01_015779 [Bienertia sinuspersici]
MAFISRARNRGVRFNVQFNERGQPIGDHSEKIISYWGSIVKKSIPITFENWHKVLKTLKDTLFEDLTTITFDVSMFWKKWFLTRAGEIWKNFKQLRDVPLANMISLTPLTGEDLLKSRLTKEFQERSNANRHRGKDNKYPQKKGRRGCARFEQDLLCDELIRRAHEWEFDDVGCEDVLQRAFKKKEPGGRVMAVGKGVSQSSYFGSLPSKKEYKHELIEVNARLKRMEHEIMVLKNGRSNNEVSEKGNLDESCYDDVALYETPYIPDGAALNAIGKVHNTYEVTHTLSLLEGFMRVGIDYAIEKQTPLSIPNQDAEAFVIKEAICALILWATQLIVIDMPKGEWEDFAVNYQTEWKGELLWAELLSEGKAVVTCCELLN